MNTRVSLTRQRLEGIADQVRRLGEVEELLKPSQIEEILSQIERVALDADGVLFSPVPSEPDVDYAFNYNWVAKIVEYLQRMIGSKDPMSKSEILQSLGRVIYIPQSRTSDEFYNTGVFEEIARTRNPDVTYSVSNDYTHEVSMHHNAKPVIAFPYENACFYVDSGISLAGSIPVGKQDWVLCSAVVSHDIVLPSEWTTLFQSTPLSSGHRMVFLCKQASIDGVETITIVQEQLGDIYLNLMSIDSIKGFHYTPKDDARTILNGHASYDVQKDDSAEVIWGCFASSWTTSGSYSQWNSDDLIHSPIDSDISMHEKQANFYDNLGGVNRRFATTMVTPAIIDYVEILR